MEVKYKHNLEDNYLIISDNSLIVDDYKIRMITENNIGGLLSIYINYINGNTEMSYIITSKQNLREYFEKNKVGFSDLQKLTIAMLKVLDNVNKYLLEEDSIVLDMKYIYIDMTTEEIYFCYYPNYRQNVENQFYVLMQEMISMVDHKDRKSVQFAYGILEVSSKDGFKIEELQDFIGDFENKNKEFKEADFYKENSRQKEECCRDNQQVVEEIMEERIDVNEEIYVDSASSMIKNVLSSIKIPSIKKLEKRDNENTALYSQDKKETGYCKYEKDYEQERECDNTYVAENDTMYINDIVWEQQRKLFSMSEQDDILLNNFPFIIGKIPGKADGIIRDNSISRMHAKIELNDNREFTIEDLNSKNGTYVNDDILNPYEKVKIDFGDKITIAAFDYIFR